MKALKIIGLILLTGILLVLVAVAFTSPKKHIERSIVIHASPEAVFKEVNTFKSFSQWSPWSAMDPEEKLILEGPEYGPGAKVVWDGKKVGKGSQWIIASEENKHVKNQLEFESFKGAFYADFHLEPTESGTKVTWSYDGDYTGTGLMNNGMGKFFNWFMDGMIGSQYDLGLASLKKLVESKSAVH